MIIGVNEAISLKSKTTIHEATQKHEGTLCSSLRLFVWLRG
jgi:hypothetical protein